MTTDQLSMPSRWSRSSFIVDLPLLVVLAGLVGLAVFPHVVGPHYGSLMLTAIGYCVALLGLNLLLGYTGLLSIGHAMFLAVGAYTSAYMTSSGWLSLELILLVAIVAGAAIALPVGFLCVRYERIYFSMLTLAFSMLLYSFLFKFYHITGGDEGMLIRTPKLLGQSFARMDKMNFLTGPLYYYSLTLLVLLTLLMLAIVRSVFGLRLRSIRENAQKAEFLGVNVKLHRLIAFIIAAVYGSIGGVLVGIPVGLADPTIAYWVQSGNLIFMLLLGGYTNFFGPVLGAILFVFFQDQLMSITEYWRFTFGVLLLVIVVFLPRGMMGLLDYRARWST
jgi:branched-chain amino acid transport system permease protein